MSNDKLERVVIVGDMHYPFTIPAVMDVTKPEAETPFTRFLKDFDPHHYVDLGDFMDLAVISHWNSNKPRITEGQRLKREYDACNVYLDNLARSMPSLVTHTRLEGNHEAWIEDKLDIEPALEGLLEVNVNLRLEQRGIKWVRRRLHHKIGKLNFIHGDYKDGLMPVYASRAIGILYGRSVVCGHMHQNQVYSGMTPIDKHPFQVTVLGTLANANPVWRKNQPSNWTNSFAVAEIEPNGTHHLKVINIINNRFVYDGVVYK